MLKEHAKLFSRVIMLTDLILVAVAFLLAHSLRNAPFAVGAFGRIGPFSRYQGMLFVTLPVAYFVFKYTGLYASHRTRSIGQILWLILRALCLVAVVMAAVIFFIKAKFFSRSLFVLFILISFCLIAAEKCSVRFAQRRFRRRGYNIRYCLLVGTAAKLKGFVERLSRHEEWGLRIVGYVSLGPEPAGQPDLGTWENLAALLRERVVDEVVFAVPQEHLADLELHLQECEEVGVTARVIAEFFSPSFASMAVDTVDGLPLLTYTTTPQNALALALKRGLDVVVSLIGLICLSPFFAAIALAVTSTSPGPVFFRQKRMGKNGRLFVFYKFRSMYVDAEERRKELEPLNEMTGPVFKIRNDPRRTPVGRFLRRFSLDETPQLWNVLKGDMSLVGPRPPIPSEVRHYDTWQRRRLSMKPGLTCLWQIGGRNTIDFEEWMKLDLKYIDSWSLWLDLKILLKTVVVIFFGKGAS